MGKYDIRDNYDLMLNRLRMELGEDKIDASIYSDYQLLVQINNKLATLNCQKFTKQEMDEIACNMN